MCVHASFQSLFECEDRLLLIRVLLIESYFVLFLSDRRVSGLKIKFCSSRWGAVALKLFVRVCVCSMPD